MSDMWITPVIVFVLDMVKLTLTKTESDKPSWEALTSELKDLYPGKIMLLRSAINRERTFTKYVFKVIDEKGTSVVTKEEFNFFFEELVKSQA